MKPPICSLCKKNHRTHPDEEFKLLYFKLSPEQIDRKAKMLSENKVGYKPGARWFCATDRQRVVDLTHLTWREAEATLALHSEGESLKNRFLRGLKSVLGEDDFFRL